MPLFSIVVPCFNAADTIQSTLDSIARQTVTDWEVICVDDGSTDATTAILAEAAQRDRRIRWYRNTGQGPSSARNLAAWWIANAEVLAFCDADDEWHREKLADLAKAFRDPETDAVYGKTAFFKERPDDARTMSQVGSGALTISDLLGENPVCTMSNFAIRRNAMINLGAIDEAIVHNEDLEWLIRLVGLGACIKGRDTLHTFYRNSPSGLSANLAAMYQGRQAALQTAARFGYQASPTAEAIYHRYLSRRALRLGLPATTALLHAVRGCLLSPSGFFNVPRRGAMTLGASVLGCVMPRRTRNALFSR